METNALQLAGKYAPIGTQGARTAQAQPVLDGAGTDDHRVILFLDFDGVVHERDAGRSGLRRYEFLPRIENVLRDFPEVVVVVSSDWRMPVPDWSARWARARVSADLRSRVIGAVPDLGEEDQAVGRRRREAEAYLRDNGMHGSQWIALDDNVTIWGPADSRLLVCDDGFRADDEERLRDALAAMRQQRK